MANQFQKATIASFNKVTGTGRVTITGGGTLAATNFPSWSDPGFNPSNAYTDAQLNLYTQSARGYLPDDSSYKYTLEVRLSFSYGDEILLMDTAGRKVILGIPRAAVVGQPVPGNTTAPPEPPAAAPSPVGGGSEVWQNPVQTLADLEALESPLVGQTHLVRGECALYTYAPDCGGWKRQPLGGGGSGGSSSASGILDDTRTEDGAFGDPGTGSVAGLANGDTYDTAFDKLDTVLAKLLPAKPKNLSAVPLTVVGGYSALQQGSGTLRATVIDSAVPVARADGFWDGDSGTLSGTIDGRAVTGTKTLSAASDVALSTAGSPRELEILTDADPYAGIVGKKGFWTQLTASLTSSFPLSLGGVGHEFKLVHSKTGESKVTAFVDDPQLPVLKNKGLTATRDARIVSGVPCLGTGDTIRATFDVERAVSEFYHPVRIGRIESPAFTGVDAPLPAVPPLKGSIFTATNLTGTVKAGVFAANASVTLRGYNAKGTAQDLVVTNFLRVDSLSDETLRVKSGTGQFPLKGAAGFGDAYDSAALLTANEELQLEGGKFRYPAAVNYSNLVPTAGPDYSGITGGSYNTMRWATFKLDQVYGVSSLRLDLQDATGFSDAQQPGFALYVMLEGATGWLDANTAYPGVGSPNANGDAALDLSKSTPTSRRVTLGANVKSGVVYVRVGLPAGSNLSFGKIVRN